MTAKRSVTGQRRRALFLVAGLVVLGLAGAGTYYFWPRSGLPPLTTSPFLNTRPGVTYVGDQSCAGCHADQSRSYHQHPMGRSLFTAADAPPLEQYDSKANNPFQVGPFHFQVKRLGSKLIHKEWCQDAKGNVVAQLEAEIAYVVGSGTQARSYVYQRDGFLYESPITWYTAKSEWHLSPGYEEKQQHFSRPIDRRCLYCHCQEAHPVEHTVNRYREPVFGQLAIGCERCHGPGELHVARREQGLPPGDVDLTIVNPRHLAPTLREAVCEQCHLQGEEIVVRRGRAQTDYRPGLPLHEYLSIFVRSPEAQDAKKIVSHVEQMHLSACFKKSNGKFGCISCHDPHAWPSPEEKVTFYRQRCLNCHAAAQQPVKEGPWVKAPDCSLPMPERVTKDGRDNCLACHLPRNPSSNVTHFAVTDHRVPRRPEEFSPRAGAPRPPKADPELGPGDVPLLAFHRQLLSPEDDGLPRDLGLAMIQLAKVAEGVGAERIRDHLSQRALPLLNTAVMRAPDDVPAVEARGFALVTRGQLEGTLKPLEDVLAKTPDREKTLGVAVRTAEAMDRLDLAERYCQRLAEHYPQDADNHLRLAVIRVKREDWPRALEAARAAVQVDPFRAESRAVLIAVLLETGDRARAQREFDVLGAINPDYQEKIRSWFGKRLAETK